MNRAVVILLVGLNLLTISTLTIFMINADSFVEYFDLRLKAIDATVQLSDTRLALIDNRIAAKKDRADDEAKYVRMLFSNVFDALTHVHNEEIRPMFEALEPLIQHQKGTPPNDNYIRPLRKESKDLEARIITATH